MKNLDHEIIGDRVFIKSKNSFIKIDLAKVNYIQADRNYSYIFTKEKKYIIVCTLKKIEEKLSSFNFIRIHRSYLINLLKIDEVNDKYVVVSKKTIPLSKSFKIGLLDRLQIL